MLKIKVSFFLSSKLSDYNLVFMAMNFNDDNEQTKNIRKIRSLTRTSKNIKLQLVPRLHRLYHQPK